MWKRLLVLILLISVILPASPVLADTSANVTITAVGFIVEVPGNFTVYYISDYEVGLSWTKPVDAANTMIRAKYGSVPTSRTDGYLVYYGPDDGIGETISDTGVNFEEGASDVYYRAWSQRIDGVWEEIGTSNFMENPYMLLIALLILAMGFTITSYVFKKGVLAFAGAGSWMVTSIYCFSKSSSDWDVYFSLAWLFIGLVIACAFSPLAWRETTPIGETPEEPDIRDMREEIEAWNKERSQYSFLYSNKRGKRKGTRFQRTGEE